MASLLSKELRKKYGVRNIEVRKGDEVKVMRGKFKKKTGKVGNVDLKRVRIAIDGIERAKKAGEKVAVWFAPSKVMIMDLNLDDMKRLKRIKKGDAGKEVKADKAVVKKEEKKTETKPREKKDGK